MVAQVALVRYGRLRHIAEFSPRARVALDPGRACVVETPRGIELGHLLSVLEGAPARERGALLRMATAADEQLGREQDELAADELRRVREVAASTPARVIAVERLLGEPRAIVYYGAKERVDVPELLARLGEALGVEVHLHQVGARQRARICGGCGSCGRTLCCASFLRALEPVTMRMAKIQGLDLDPHATAGACGRLKCCLRYETPHYEDERRGLPRVGWSVRSARVEGRAVAIDILRRKVLVQPEGGAPRLVFAAEIEHASPPTRGRLPLAGEPAPAAESETEVPIERGWSTIARRLWGRFRARGKSPEDPHGGA